MKSMAKFFLSPRERSLSARITSVVLAVFVASVLAACGGGGGSGSSSGISSPIVAPPPDPGASAPTNPPPPDPGASSPVNPPSQPIIGKLEVKPSPDCVIETAGIGTCPRTLSATDMMNDTAGIIIIVTPTGDRLPASVSVPIEAPLGDSTYKLVYDNMYDNIVLATATVKVSCGAKLEKQGDVCGTPAMMREVYYDRANLTISGEVFADSGNGTLAVGYPQLIVGTTLILPKNKTGEQVGLCMLPSMKLPNGLLPISCHHDPVKNFISIFLLDPVKQELLPKYTGELPVGMEFYASAYGVFGTSPYTKYGVSMYGAFIDVPGVGTYYLTDTGYGDLFLTRDGFKTYEVVDISEDFSYHVLMTYSNPAP